MIAALTKVVQKSTDQQHSLVRASNDADLTISLEHCQQHVAYFGDVPIEPQVLEDVMLAQSIASRCCFVKRTIPDDHVAATLDQEAECMGAM